MTNPGYQSQQAAAAASRAQQAAANSYYLAHRNDVRRPRRGGVLGAIRRLVGLVFSLVVIAIAIGIFLLILSQAQPDWFDQVMSWF